MDVYGILWMLLPPQSPYGNTRPTDPSPDMVTLMVRSVENFAILDAAWTVTPRTGDGSKSLVFYGILSHSKKMDLIGEWV